MKEMRPVVVKQNPKLGSLDVVRALAEKYKSIDPALMQRFEKEYQKDQEEYLKKKFAYESKLTPDQKQSIVDAKENLLERKEKLAYKKVRKGNLKDTLKFSFLNFKYTLQTFKIKFFKIRYKLSNFKNPLQILI